MLTDFSLYVMQPLSFSTETDSFSKRMIGSPAIAETSTGSAASCSDSLGMLIEEPCSETAAASVVESVTATESVSETFVASAPVVLLAVSLQAESKSAMPQIRRV